MLGSKTKVLLILSFSLILLGIIIYTGSYVLNNTTGYGVRPQCTATWKCYSTKVKGYQLSNCRWKYLTSCPNGCLNGACQLIQNCTARIYCINSTTIAEQLPPPNCSVINTRICQYGCSNNACNPVPCKETYYCQNANNLVHQLANCSIFITPCSYGCANNVCNPAPCVEKMICQGDILTHQYPNCSVIQERTCEYGCANGACNPPPPKQCNNGSLCIAFVSPTPIDGSNVTDIQIKTNVTGAGELSSFIDFDRSLFSYWDLNGDLLDKSGYANHGTNYGATCNVGGKFGLACSFDGFNDYILAKGLTMTPRDSWALEAWIKPAVLPQTFGSAVYNGDDNGGYGFGIGNPGSTLTGLFGGARWIDTGYDFPSANQWYHVAMIRSNGTVYFYVNGDLKYTDVLGAPIPPNNYLTIGCELDGSDNPYRYFNGTIDEVRVWNRALSAQEIRASYNSQIYKLERNFTDLAFREYEVYAYVTDQFKASDKTEIRVIKNIHPRGIAGDLWADTIIGKPDFSEITPNEVVADKIFIPFGGGVVVDKSVSPGRLYVWDGGNSRILGIDLSKCYSAPSRCSADIVIGQPSATDHSACNGDGNYQNYPDRALASASTLCGLGENSVSIMESITYASMYVDGAGNLYVPDRFNSRILKYISPFTTDTKADDVWGQDNFADDLCNKGSNSPSASSLCFDLGGGVTFDSAGNMWVADSENHRVLRFLKNASGGISKTADIVLGQSDFITKSYGSTLNKMRRPIAVRFDNNGWLYVADLENGRILVFKPPFVSGMSASGTFGSKFNSPSGIEMDPSGQGIWIDDSGNGMVELWDFNGVTVKKILGKDTYKPDGNLDDLALAGGGSMGFDANGKLIVSSSQYMQDVLIFSPPFPDPKAGNVYQPTKKLFSPPISPNIYGSKGLGVSVKGVEVTDSQLIAADNTRLLFWNNPQSLVNGKPADGVVVPGSATQNFTSFSPWATFTIRADNQQRLWVVIWNNPSEVWVYNLPLTTGAQPIKILSSPFPVLGGGQINFTGGITGIMPSPNGDFLWLSNSMTNRVVRIRNPLTNPQVDVILGQKDISGTLCNRGEIPPAKDRPSLRPSADMLCQPGHVRLDRYGNLFVSDHSLEVEGNWRFLEFDKSLFPTYNAQVIFAPNATKIFPMDGTPVHATWEPAFDSCNRMVVGYGLPFTKFIGLYTNPLGASKTPDAYLKDYNSAAFSTDFDSQDNLYVADLNRARVLIYKKPFGVCTTPIT